MNQLKNRHFFFVYQPRKELGYSKRRFAVSKNKIAQYLGADNANKILLKAINLESDSLRMKFRKYGTVDIYQK